MAYADPYADAFEDPFLADDEGDSLTGAQVGAPAGALASLGLWDTATSKSKRFGDWQKRNPNASRWLRNAASAAGGLAGGALGQWLLGEDEAFDPETVFETERLAEDGLDAETDDEAFEAVDEMVRRSAGLMRASARFRREVLPGLIAVVRRVIQRGRQDPRYRVLAKVAPLALRRTVMLLMQQAAAGRPVAGPQAVALFKRHLATLAQNPSLRQAALRRHGVQVRGQGSRGGAGAVASGTSRSRPRAAH